MQRAQTRKWEGGTVGLRRAPGAARQPRAGKYHDPHAPAAKRAAWEMHDGVHAGLRLQGAEEGEALRGCVSVVHGKKGLRRLPRLRAGGGD